MTKPVVVAIDGPAGAGKSTVAKLVAERLKYLYIDTGAMYRAITVKALRLGMSLADAAEVEALAKHTKVELTFDEQGNQRVLLDDEDVSQAIRTHEVSQRVSEVAAMPGVRHEMVRLQRDMADNQSTVMDGRDIASYVLPNADFKFFLTASPEVRALRRQKDLADQGHQVDVETLKQDIIERDRKDSQREMAPLVMVPEAELIDSSNMDIQEVVDRIISRIEGDNH